MTSIVTYSISHVLFLEFSIFGLYLCQISFKIDLSQSEGPKYMFQRDKTFIIKVTDPGVFK